MKWILVILDGFGLSNEERFNGIKQATTPVLDELFEHYPWVELQASEEYVGLPKGQMGNSEIGHLTIGAGRMVRQGLFEIDHAIQTGAFKGQSFLQSFTQHSKKCHLMGLYSDGGVHSHMNHLNYLAQLFAENGIHVFLHLFTDGRDTPPKKALEFLDALPNHPLITPATLQGRFYAMDRDQRFDRTKRAYDAIVNGIGKRADSYFDAIQSAYQDGVTDEFIEPFIIGDYRGAEEGHSLCHANFRADRVRQLMNALVLPNFDKFQRTFRFHEGPVRWGAILGMSNYSSELDAFVPALYPSQTIRDGLVQTLTSAGKTVLKVAETEKYAHVTFFLNGGVETPYPGENRVLIPSPQVLTYDLAPEMSAREVTEAVLAGIREEYDLIVVNYANPDMVGHTGVQSAIIQAIECVDKCLFELYRCAKASGYGLMVTADHGNAEQMVEGEDPKSPHTAHTCNPVPCIIITSDKKSLIKDDPSSIRTLADIAPTLLRSMHIAIPPTMTGQCLFDDV